MILHKKQCKNFDNIYTNHINQYQTEKTAFFHCITTGHYWRNSHITELSLLTESSDHTWTFQTWTTESDMDEYDLLNAFAKAISHIYVLIGYNSTSFHIPYLENKTKAYELSSLFSDKQTIDLLKLIKPIGNRLHISTKLNDLRIFLQIPDECTEIECIARSTGLFVYEQVLNGSFDVQSASRIDEEVLFVCHIPFELPASFRMNTENFYLIGENRQLKIKVKLIDGQFKLFFPNYKDYFYLLEEGTVLHKSLAATIAKDKKRKALPEECFSYVAYTAQFENNLDAVKKYLCALLKH